MTISARRVVNSANTPTAVELGPQQAVGIVLDNYSGFWLRVANDYFVPPFTLGWAADLVGSYAGGLTIQKGTPTTLLTNPPTGVTEGAIVINIFDNYVSPSSGFPIIGQPNNWDFNDEVAVAAGSTTFATTRIPKGSQIRSFQLTAILTAGTLARIELRLFDGAITQTVWETLITNALFVVVVPGMFIAPTAFSPAGGPAWIGIIRRQDITGVGAYNYSFNIQWS